MSNTKKHIVCGVVANIISDAFLDGFMFGAGLPASLMMYEAMKKLNIDAKHMCGTLMYGSFQKLASVHFWIEFDGKIYDPSRKLTEYFNAMHCHFDVDNEKYKFYPGCQDIESQMDSIMMKTYIDLQTNYETAAKRYFDGAPKQLKAIRRNVQKRVNKLMKPF